MCVCTDSSGELYIMCTMCVVQNMVYTVYNIFLCMHTVQASASIPLTVYHIMHTMGCIYNTLCTHHECTVVQHRKQSVETCTNVYATKNGRPSAGF